MQTLLTELPIAVLELELQEHHKITGLVLVEVLLYILNKLKDPRGAGIGTPEAILHVWSSHREIINDFIVP